MNDVKISRESVRAFGSDWSVCLAGTEEEREIEDAFMASIEALNAEVDKVNEQLGFLSFKSQHDNEVMTRLNADRNGLAVANEKLFENEMVATQQVAKLTAELDQLSRGDGMSVEDWYKFVNINALSMLGSHDLADNLSKLIPTRRQGFTVDAETWKNAPEWATGIVSYWVIGTDPQFTSEHVVVVDKSWTPRPAPKTRGKTVELFCTEWASWYEKEMRCSNQTALLILLVKLAASTPENPVTIYSLCTAAGISLTEVVE